MSNKNIYTKIFNNIGGFLRKFRRPITVVMSVLSIISLALGGYLILNSNSRLDAYAASDINIVLIQLQTGTDRKSVV